MGTNLFPQMSIIGMFMHSQRYRLIVQNMAIFLSNYVDGYGGMNSIPPKICPPRLSECELFGNRVFAGVIS